jgi:Flp pilus assembly pilin Flp
MMKKLTHLWSDESGASAIELALIAVFILVPLLLGSTELGRRIWVMSELNNAVRVGTEYVMANHLSGSGITGTSLQNAVRTATNLGTAITIAPPSACGSAYSCFGCPTSSGVTLSSTSTTCGAGGTSGTYAGLTASVSYTPLFHACGSLLRDTWVCPLTTAASTLSSTAVARIQ